MKRRTSMAFLVLAAGLAVAGLLHNQTVFGAGATVKKGSCGAIFFGGNYQGEGTYIQTPSGQITGVCNAFLVSGTPVNETTQVEFSGQTPFGMVPTVAFITPSGNAEIISHN